jgi:hypothetical protein
VQAEGVEAALPIRLGGGPCSRLILITRSVTSAGSGLSWVIVFTCRSSQRLPGPGLALGLSLGSWRPSWPGLLAGLRLGLWHWNLSTSDSRR